MIPRRFWHGKTGHRTESGRCSQCQCSGFVQSNGNEVSADGVRGYRCMQCDTIKPEPVAMPGFNCQPQHRISNAVA